VRAASGLLEVAFWQQKVSSKRLEDAFYGYLSCLGPTLTLLLKS